MTEKKKLQNRLAGWPCFLIAGLFNIIPFGKISVFMEHTEPSGSTFQDSSRSNWGHYRPGWSSPPPQPKSPPSPPSGPSPSSTSGRAPPAPAGAFRLDTQIPAGKHLLTLARQQGPKLSIQQQCICGPSVLERR